MTISEKVDLFSQQIGCDGNIYTWCYDSNGQLLHSNCPSETLLNTAFGIFGCHKMMMEHSKEKATPILPGTAMGLEWACVYEKNGEELKRIYVMGPVFTTDTSLEGIDHALRHYEKAEMSPSWKREFIKNLENLPVVPTMIFTRYATMLHYAVAGEKVSLSDVLFSNINLNTIDEKALHKDRHKIWHHEQVLLRMIREGDINYKKAINTAQTLSSGVPVRSKDPLRQAKDSIIVFTSLCTRAAIEGGLSPELAYTLGDAYIQKAEDAATLSDISPIGGIMYEDFVKRVRKSRTNPKVSRQIQACLDYIELHTEEKIALDGLARQIGYAEYYLSRKFKNEVGTGINEYIKFAKVERAKTMLSTTEESIQAIADKLGFCSRSYFAVTFGRIAGCTPLEYRNKFKSI